MEALKHYVAIEKQPGSKWVEKAREILKDLSAEATPAAGATAASAPATTGAKPVAKTAPAGSPFAEAQALRDHGQIDGAIAKYQQAIAADPKHMPARAALGELLLKVHRDDEAIEVFRAALDKNPAFAAALYDLAFALRVRDRPAEAVDAYQRYIKLRPDRSRRLLRPRPRAPAPRPEGRRAQGLPGLRVDGEAPCRASLGRGGAGADRSRSRRHRSAPQAIAVSSGRSRVKVAPAAASLSTVSVPPWARAICRPM